MKKILCVLLAMLFVGFTFAGCAGKTDDTATTKAASTIKTIKTGTLMVGMEVGYPPMEYLDKDGTTTIGFDVELAQKMADLLGLKLEIVNTAWDGIFAALDKGEFDMIMSSVSITPERQEKYILTAPYISNKIVLAVAKNSTTGITDIASLNGKKVAVQNATTSDDFAKDLLTKGSTFEINRYEKVTQCYDELALGRVDAILVDEVVAAAYLDVSNIIWRNSEGEPMGICLKKGNDALAAIVEKSIDTFYFDGTIATIATKYFGSNVTQGVRTVTTKPVIDLTK
jgi:polar amino acid transport system substrate-binding protein